MITYHSVMMVLLLILTAESPIIFIWFFVEIFTDNLLLIMGMVIVVILIKGLLPRLSLIPAYGVMIGCSFVLSYGISLLMPLIFHRPYSIFLLRFGASLCGLISIASLLSSYNRSIPLLERGLCVVVCITVFLLTR